MRQMFLARSVSIRSAADMFTARDVIYNTRYTAASVYRLSV